MPKQFNDVEMLSTDDGQGTSVPIERPSNKQIKMEDTEVTQQVLGTGSSTHEGQPSGVPDQTIRLADAPTGAPNDPSEVYDADPVMSEYQGVGGRTSIEENAAARAEMEFNYEVYKAKADAIQRRAKNYDENTRSMEQYFSTNFNNAAMVDKFGWTGGAQMDADTRMQYLQATLNADMYSRDMYVNAELQNQIAIAREYANLKYAELAQEAFQHAEEMSMLRYQIDGTYISPAMNDMLNNYQLALQNGDDAMISKVEAAFLAMGYGEEVVDESGNPVLDENGQPARSIDPQIMNALFFQTETFAERQLKFEEYMFEMGQTEALHERELRYGVDQTSDGLQAGNLPGHGFQSDFSGSVKFWNAHEEEWQNAADFDEWTKQHSPEDGEISPTASNIVVDGNSLEGSETQINNQIGTIIEEQNFSSDNITNASLRTFLENYYDTDNLSSIDIQEGIQKLQAFDNGELMYDDWLEVRKQLDPSYNNRNSMRHWFMQLEGFEFTASLNTFWQPTYNSRSNEVTLWAGHGSTRDSNYDWKGIADLAESLGLDVNYTYETRSFESRNLPKSVHIGGLSQDQFYTLMYLFNLKNRGTVSTVQDIMNNSMYRKYFGGDTEDDAIAGAGSATQNAGYSQAPRE